VQSLNLSQNTNTTTLTADGAATQINLNVGAATGSWVTSNYVVGQGGGQTAVTNVTMSNGATANVPGTVWGSGGIANSGPGVSTFVVQSGAKINAGGAVFAAGTNSISSMTLTGAGSQLNFGTLLLVGGNGTVQSQSGVMTITDGGAATVAQNTGGVVIHTAGTLNVGTGTSPGTMHTAGDMVVNGNVFYNAGSLSAGGTLGVGGNVLLSSANRNASGTPSNKKLLEVGQATLTTTGVIDLNDNDMLIHHNDRARYENFVKAARNNGAWNMPGITSTAAKNSVPANKNLGVLSGAEYLAVNGTPFNGKTVVAGDTVIKFTFNGDTDFNGVVNFDDYARVDSGFNNGRSGWLNGDFDYNGLVNFDDYSLIDNAFNTQGSQILSAAGDPAGPGFDRTIVAVSLGNNVSSINDAGAFLTGHEADFAQDMQQPEGLTGGNGT
jgi:hypothetical protein